MDWRRHSECDGKHAILSASKYHWLNYSDDKLYDYVDKLHAARRGTQLHELAHKCIKLRVKLPNTNKTIDAYVNDAIGYRMNPEQVLYYSPYAFGTADAISFRDGVLRIFDLKTGDTKVTGVQLAAYAAFFCLEYNVKPFEIEFDLRIYQSDEVIRIEVDAEEIAHIMSRTVELNKLLTVKMEEEV